MAKVVLIGACGGMGRAAVDALLTLDEVEELVAADIDEVAIDKLVGELADPRVSGTMVNILDEPQTARLMSQGDVVVNTAGPFFRLGVAAVRAAIAARTPYVDINDDYRPTIDALEFDQWAAEAGIPVLIGMGGSPGMSNLMAKKACQALDEIETIQTAWGWTGGVARPKAHREVDPDAELSAAYVHWVYASGGEVPVWRDGRRAWVKPIVESETVVFPEGEAEFSVIGHPEPVTLPRCIPGVQRSSNLMGTSPDTRRILAELGDLAQAGELSPEEAAKRFLVRWQEAREVRDGADLGPRIGAPMCATATGRSNGKTRLLSYGLKAGPRGGMAAWTGIPVALGAQMLLRGEFDDVGVFPPEACINPDLFFDRLAPFCENAVAGEDVLYTVEQDLA